MTLRKLPEAAALERPQNYQWDAPSDVLEKWAAAPLAASSGENTITMFDLIGEDPWTGGGVTAKRVAGALRAIGEKDVTVQINSPGGDLFEGIAIYNLLVQHRAKVTVDVLGWAASAASIIAMAGDEIRMGLGSFMMVHNAWGVVVGNQHDMRDAADAFQGFDGAIADIYQARTGLARSKVEALMDAETYMSANEAVKKGFADTVAEDISAPEATNQTAQKISARRRLDAALAQSGLPRSERRRMLAAATGMHDAAGDTTAMPGAGLDLAAATRLIETMKA
jgi:ATP-dependent Clp endopeptidase proteolytic subunit ClpP